MPTNLPPEYFEVERQYRAAKTTEEKIRLLEELMSTIPKHKGTDKLRADLRRRMSKLKDSMQQKKQPSRHASLFRVEKEGDGRVVFAGPPNTGKSSLLAALTNATPKISNSPYTTWVPLPGMMTFENVHIQLIDTPPLSSEHVEPELIGLMRTADLLLIIIDLQNDPLGQLQETVTIIRDHGITLFPATEERQKIPTVPALPVLVAVNKTDNTDLLEDFQIFCELLEEDWPLVGISAQSAHNLDKLQKMIFDGLHIIRIYSKPPGKEPDFNTPFVLKAGSTVEEFAGKVHKDFLENLKTARIWGRNVYDGQFVGRDHVLHDGDVVELHT
ncbi:MAG: 50S ribosome-binding GTPase [Calditrichia bacterium]